MKKMQEMMNPHGASPGQTDMRMSRIKKEYNLCSNHPDLIQIGCSFGLENQNNFNIWKVTMLGPQGTPYQGGLFVIKVLFPPEYPSKGAEFRFINKIYHLNVDWKNKETFGHICLSSLNEWATTGKVKAKSCFGVKQALFDIFCLFYNQGVESPYDDAIAKQYKENRAEFDALAKEFFNEVKIGGLFSRKTLSQKEAVQYTADRSNDPILKTVPKALIKDAQLVQKAIFKLTGVHESKMFKGTAADFVLLAAKDQCLIDEAYIVFAKQTNGSTGNLKIFIFFYE